MRLRRWKRLEIPPHMKEYHDHMRGVCISSCPICGTGSKAAARRSESTPTGDWAHGSGPSGDWAHGSGCFVENCSICPPSPDEEREARILGWERFIRAKQSTLIGRSWDVTHPDDLRDYACHVVNEEEALAAFLAKEVVLMADEPRRMMQGRFPKKPGMDTVPLDGTNESDSEASDG